VLPQEYRNTEGACRRSPAPRRQDRRPVHHRGWQAVRPV